MPNNNFVVKNGLTVNGSFTANSTSVNAATITATAVIVGANVSANSTVLFVGNTTVNTNISAGQISVSGAVINSTSYPGTANNSTNFNGQSASFYANASNITAGILATARLSTSGTANSITFLSGDQTYKTAVTSVSAGNGLTGAAITTTGSLAILSNSGISANASGVFVIANNGLLANATGVFVNANNGVTSNTSGLFVTQGTGAVVNATGVHVNATYIATLTVNSSVFSTSSPSNTFTVGTSAYFVSNGNVGIGTTTPGSKLEISGSVVSTGSEITIGTGQNEQKRLRFWNAGRNVHFYLDTSGLYALYDQTGGFNRWYTDNSGNFVASGNIIAYSDVRLKINIKPIENALDTIVKLQGVKYNRKSDNTEQIGLIAQEVQKILPEVILEDQDGMLGVAYGNIVALLIESVKDLKKEVDFLKQKSIQSREIKIGLI
jgi:hypothetical protein